MIEYGFREHQAEGRRAAAEQEAAGMLALARAFPGTPLRIDPNANWVWPPA